MDIKFLIFNLIILLALPVLAIKTIGRFTLGVSTATERFTSTEFGSDKNDSLYSSQRMFYKVSEIGNDRWEVVTDLRNKYDSFNTLNKELYQLDPKDDFQARQLSLRMVNPDGLLSPTLGRFQVPEAGSVFVDGGSLQFKLKSGWYTGLFAGLNPKQIDKPYLVSDSKANQTGAYLTYQAHAESWNLNSYLSHGIVQQNYNSQTERQYLFHSGIYQWEEDSRIISLAYLDFVPTTNVQTLNLIYQQKVNSKLAFEMGALGIDVVEYKRRQNVLEKLNSSPYKDAHLGFELKTQADAKMHIRYSSGKRSYDQLQRNELSLGYGLQNFISQNWDTQMQIFNRKNFTSDDSGLDWSLGYFSKNYELELDSNYSIQKNIDGTTTHPILIDLSISSFISKELFASFSFQRAADENVTIIGSFIKIGYRFGNQEIPPLRDGTAPRGRL